MTTTAITGVFYAEVCDENGPTGELVFVDRAELQDYGGNKLAGPFTSVSSALRRQKQFRVASRFHAVKGSAYRVAGYEPTSCADHPSLSCGAVAPENVGNREWREIKRAGGIAASV